MSDIKHPTIYKDEHCELFLENFHDDMFIHCYIYDWRKGLVDKFDVVFLHTLNALRDRGVDKLHAAILPRDYKLKKFAEMFGFSATEKTMLDDKKQVREVYVCST